MHKLSDGKIHSAKTDWSAVLYLLLGGVIVAFQLGKVSPNLPLILTEFNMSRVSAGVFVSIFSLIGAGIGTFAGGILSSLSEYDHLLRVFYIDNKRDCCCVLANIERDISV